MEISLYSPDECEKIAKDARLRYVNDTMPGITRKRAGKGFAYYYPDKTLIKDFKELKRLKSLAIPPAYQNVWICPFANGHIQATGRDSKNRKQYSYHTRWQLERQKTKFSTMEQFGHALPAIRTHIHEQLSKPINLNKVQVICAIIYLLDNCHIRIGNSVYAKQNKSFGVTTLRKKHLSFEANTATLEFIGKNAKLWHVVLKEKKIIKILKKCEEIPGYELFKYIDDDGNLNVITSQDINNYLHTLTQHTFTAKDFRTWAACRETLKRFINSILEDAPSSRETYKLIIEEVADLLGHTPAICQKSYIATEIITWWDKNQFPDWIKFRKKKLATLNDDELLLYWLKKLT